jgi:hypothetical protein
MSTSMAETAKQQAIWTGAGIVFRTVRQIQRWHGRTVGIVRNNRGAEYVVQHVIGKDRWDELSGVGLADLRAEASVEASTHVR